jgi:hypothetical protein
LFGRKKNEEFGRKQKRKEVKSFIEERERVWVIDLISI